MPIILLTNDDGIHAPGLAALAESLAGLGRLITVAPDREQSAASHALTLRRPLRILPEGPDRYSVDGTPTDCVVAAFNGLLDERPDLVISGMNHGPNMGDDVTYSGTVSAAFEGAILGVPSLAVSLATFDAHDYETAYAVIPWIVNAVVHHGLPERALLNVNVPSIPLETHRGIRITHLGHRVYQDVLEVRTDPRGKDYYWIGGDKPTWKHEEGSDFTAINDGFTSITPLSLDLTHTELAKDMASWSFGD